MGSMFGGGSSSQNFAQNYQRLPQPALPRSIGQGQVNAAQQALGANPQAYGQNYQALVNAMLARKAGAMPQATAPTQPVVPAPVAQQQYNDAHSINDINPFFLGGAWKPGARRNYSYARDGGGFQMDRSRSVGGIGSDYAADKARR